MCPHCSTAAKFNWISTDAICKENEDEIGVQILYCLCPNCEEIVIYLQGVQISGPYLQNIDADWEKLLYPKQSNSLDSEDIPKKYLEDYEEALKVLSASPKASAALTRRLLQSILRDEYHIKEKSLSQEIEKFINLDGIPSHLTLAVDAIRHIGNLAAHPTKDKSTGEIVAVESGEAEWLIEVVEALFDFTFIQPIKLERRKNELNLKLEKAGKPKMK